MPQGTKRTAFCVHARGYSLVGSGEPSSLGGDRGAQQARFHRSRTWALPVVPRRAVTLLRLPQGCGRPARPESLLPDCGDPRPGEPAVGLGGDRRHDLQHRRRRREITTDLMSTRNTIGRVEEAKDLNDETGEDLAIYDTFSFNRARRRGTGILSGTFDRVTFDRHTGEVYHCAADIADICDEKTASVVINPDADRHRRASTTSTSSRRRQRDELPGLRRPVLQAAVQHAEEGLPVVGRRPPRGDRR